MSARSEERDLTALASALRELRPMPEGIPRDVLMYRAGRASTHPRLWQSLAVAMTSVAATLGSLLLVNQAPPVVERIVSVPVPAASKESLPVKPAESDPLPTPEPLVREPWASTPRGRYLLMQEQVLSLGLKGIPPPPPAPPLPAPPTVEQLLRSL